LESSVTRKLAGRAGIELENAHAFIYRTLRPKL
jgi:hypothetical protein